VEFLSLNDRLRIAMETEDVLSATLASIEKRVKVGDATLSELEQQRAAIFAVRASIPTLEQQRFDALAAIAFLVATVPGNLTLSEDGLDSLAIPGVAAGVPSSLLLRRPDVRAAEAQLLAADADVAVARARILPPMDLSAQIGYSSVALSQLFVPRALFWSVVDSLTVSIFDGGRKRNEQVFSQAVQEEMVESYARTVYRAMKEAETALAAVRLSERRLAAQREASQAARRAWEISTRVYAVGGIDYLSLLETQRSYHRYLDDYQKGPHGVVPWLHQPVPGIGRRPESDSPGAGRRQRRRGFATRPAGGRRWNTGG
jgi:multidrug efflux system outer membrane protein